MHFNFKSFLDVSLQPHRKNMKYEMIHPGLFKEEEKWNFNIL